MRTLFVSGLPLDAKPRELYLLFRAYTGYESSLLKVTQKNGKTSSVSICDYICHEHRASVSAATEHFSVCAAATAALLPVTNCS